MSAIRTFRISGDKCYQLENLEMLATNVSKYNFLKCWRQILKIRMFGNAGDKNYTYNFWRTPQKLYFDL